MLSIKLLKDNPELTQVNSAKYLSVIIDHKLNWIEHISYVKCLRALYNKFFIVDNCLYTYIKHLKYKFIYINNAFHGIK